MKVKDLTREQADKICDTMIDKYGKRNELGWLNWYEICQKCPLSVGGDDGYACGQFMVFEDIEPELKNIIKKNR